jgi:hypothetical protein
LRRGEGSGAGAKKAGSTNTLTSTESRSHAPSLSGKHERQLHEPPASEQTECPSCGRVFHERAAKRHMEKCRDIRAKPQALMRTPSHLRSPIPSHDDYKPVTRPPSSYSKSNPLNQRGATADRNLHISNNLRSTGPASFTQREKEVGRGTSRELRHGKVYSSLVHEHDDHGMAGGPYEYIEGRDSLSPPRAGGTSISAGYRQIFYPKDTVERSGAVGFQKEAVESPGEWRKYFDNKSGLYYYHNASKNLTSWDSP